MGATGLSEPDPSGGGYLGRAPFGQDVGATANRQGAEEMEAKEAVQAAKNYILSLYEDEEIVDVGLEELEFVADASPDSWKVTIGFRRQWRGRPSPPPLAPKSERTYKTVRIRDDDGRLIALKHRDVSAPT